MEVHSGRLSREKAGLWNFVFVKKLVRPGTIHTLTAKQVRKLIMGLRV